MKSSQLANAQPSAAPHCLVVEDDPETLRYLHNGLREAGYEVTVSNNGPDALRLATGQYWDVIVLDRLLPGGVDGIGILEQLRADGNRTPVLILSALSNVDERVRGLHAGGDDYLSKPFAFPELLARLSNLLRRANLTNDAAQLRVADLTLDLRAMRVVRGERTIALQPREFRLLEYLMRHEGQVVTRTMLLEGVWDYHFDPQTNVIDVQVSRLRTKIDRDFASPLIHTVRGIGYMLSVRVKASDG